MDSRQVPTSDGRAADFTLVRELGRGASSVVHLARQQSLDRDVALKRLHRTLTGDPEAGARLRREAQVIAQLVHPRIVRLYDLLEDGPDLVLVMEYVRGATVESLCAATPPTPSQALAVVMDVAAALDVAASHDVVHRDVKPANVFVTSSGRCKLGDFGLARITGDQTMFRSADGSVWGTPFYMAPEQLRGAVLGPEVDVYALALVALQLLAGRHPFAGMSIRGAVEAHLDGGAAAAAARADLPSGVLEVLRDGLASAPEDRPCAAELAGRLLQAAPAAWLSTVAESPAESLPALRTSGASSPAWASIGLWATRQQGGWTVELVEEQSQSDGPDPVSPTVSTSSTRFEVAVGASPPAGGGTEGPVLVVSGEAPATKIDDRWIRQSGPYLRPSKTFSGRRLWVLVLVAFVVGFVVAIVILELTH